MRFLGDAFFLLVPLSSTCRVFILVSGTACGQFRSMVLLHAAQHITAPAISQYACSLNFANRVADVEHETARCGLQPAYVGTAWANVSEGLRYANGALAIMKR